MNDPLDRSTQVELMRSARERMETLAQRWKRVSVIGEALKRPAPNQDAERYRKSRLRISRRDG